MNNLPIATLGPSGTCSDFVLARNLFRFGSSVTIALFSTYELALEAVEQDIAQAALVAAAYPGFNELVFKKPHLTVISDSFVEETPPLIVASLTLLKQTPRTIACFRAVTPLAKDLYPDATLVPALSNSDAARIAYNGETDAALTTAPAATSHGLMELHSFGSVPMAWVVFNKRYI